jgi:hypothetical protein
MKKPTVQDLIAEIKARLTTIEDYMAWLIRADQRFCVGRRVEFSRKAKRNGIVPKTLAKKGTVKRMDTFSVWVLIDGRKQPRCWHHSFFNPVSGPKLF